MIELTNLATVIGTKYGTLAKSIDRPGIEWKNDLPGFKFRNFLWQPEANPSYLFSFCARDSFDPVFCEEMIGQIESRLCSLELDGATQLILLDNTRYSAKQFNCLLVLPNTYHRRLEKIDPEAQKYTFEVNPAWRCELLGTETPQELNRMTRGGGITFTDWNRKVMPCCYNYLFKKTQSLASKKVAWLYGGVADTRQNMKILIGDDKLPAMAIKNFLGQERLVENTRSGYHITNRATGIVIALPPEQVSDWLEAFCTIGVDEA